MSLRNFEEGSDAYNYVQWMSTQQYTSVDDEREDDRWLVYMNTKRIESETVPSETVPSETNDDDFPWLVKNPNEKEIIEKFFNDLQQNENKSPWQIWAIEKKIN